MTSPPALLLSQELCDNQMKPECKTFMGLVMLSNAMGIMGFHEHGPLIN